MCLFCDGAVSEPFVACQVCSKHFHAKSSYLHVNDNVIAALLDGCGAVNYRCCDCRVRSTRERVP